RDQTCQDRDRLNCPGATFHQRRREDQSGYGGRHVFVEGVGSCELRAMSCERPELKRRLCASLAIAYLFSAANAVANDKAEEQARPLLKAATERSLLSGDVASPYSLAASFSVHLPGAKRVDGKYVSSLTNTGDWAKQLLFADYSDLQVGHGSTVWVKRSAP